MSTKWKNDSARAKYMENYVARLDPQKYQGGGDKREAEPKR